MRQLLFLTMILPLLAVPAAALELRGECTVRFTVASTLHDFDGTGTCRPFILRITESAPAEALVEETPLVVPVAGMRTGNAGRDEKMREMFDSAHFPQITGILGEASLAELRRQLHAAAATGTGFPFRLRIREVEATVAARVSQLADDHQGLRVTLAFPVSLAAWRLKPPTVLGLIKVADEVRVNVELRLDPLPAAQQP